MKLNDFKILSNIIQKIHNIEAISLTEVATFSTFTLGITHSMNSLKSLDLSKTCLSIESSQKLVKCLKNTPNLSQLILSKVALYEATLYPIIDYLPNMKNLSLFDISYNMLSQTDANVIDRLMLYNHNLKINKKNIKIQEQLHEFTFKPTISNYRKWGEDMKKWSFDIFLENEEKEKEKKRKEIERMIGYEKWKFPFQPNIIGINMDHSYINKSYSIEKIRRSKNLHKYCMKDVNNTEIVNIKYIQNTIPHDGVVNSLVNQNLTDVKIKCSGDIYSVSCKILIYYNQKLKAIIEDRKRDEIIELPTSIDKVGFKAILKYYGFESLEITTENVISLLETSLCLDVEEIKEKCLEYICYLYL